MSYMTGHRIRRQSGRGLRNRKIVERIGIYIILILVALFVLYAMVAVGVRVPLSLAPLVGAENEHLTWVVFLLVYSFVAAVIPVWALLQPRDYINSHQLFVGLFALVLGILVAQPTITAPAFAVPPGDAPLMFPFLFVTIACGAISGFHGLVASGTTSKQVSHATDTRMIGYGGMLGEGFVAFIALVTVMIAASDALVGPDGKSLSAGRRRLAKNS